MGKLKVFLILCAFTFCCFSCKNENDSTRIDGVIVYPEFDENNQSIIYKERVYYDIMRKWHIISDDNLNKELICNFSFYNYGGNIRISDGVPDDVFIGFGKLSFMHEIVNNDILTITERYKDNKYGEWAMAEVSIGFNVVDEVFVSPLAMKAYDEGENTGLIFFQVVSGDKCLSAIYYGSTQDCIVLSDFSNRIWRGVSPEGPITSPGRFWRNINDI